MTGIILGLRTAIERCSYKVMASFIGWAQTQNQPCSDVTFGSHISKHPDARLCQFVLHINTLRLRQNGLHFPDDIFKGIFLNENVCILIKILPKFVPEGLINNIPALVQVMAWRRSGDKPSSEPMMIRLQMHIWVTRPQWVKAKL